MDNNRYIATDYGTIHGVITMELQLLGHTYSYSYWNYSPYYGWNSWESGYYHNSHCGSPIMATQIMDMVDCMVTMATIMEIPTQIKVKFTQAEEMICLIFYRWKKCFT